jgi:uncharacterized membrane protein YesL
MREKFAYLSKILGRTLAKAGDLIITNMLFILCCIPVFTAGAAEAACYARLIRIARRGDEGLQIAAFFRDFRASFKKATLAWLLELACLIVFAGDIWFAVVYSDPDNKFFLIFAIIAAAAVLLAATWLYPLIARFDNTLGGHIKNSFLMVFARFPATLLAFAVRAGMLAVPILFFDAFVYLGWFWLLFGFSLPMYLTVKLMRKQLRCEPEKMEKGAGQD